MRITILLGLLLIVLAVVALIIGVQGADNEFVNEQLTSLLCESEERLTQVETAGGRRDGGSSTTFYCEYSNGQRRDVTAGAVLAIGGAFTIPFLIGLFMVIGGAMRMAKNRMDEFTQTIASVRTQDGGVQTIDLRNARAADIPPETMKRLEEVFGRMGVAFSAMSGDVKLNQDDLTDRMEELKEALDKNLITQEEYDTIRQKLLDNFSS